MDAIRWQWYVSLRICGAGIMTIQQLGVSGGSPSTLYLATDTYANIVALFAATLPPVGTKALATDKADAGSSVYVSDGLGGCFPEHLATSARALTGVYRADSVIPLPILDLNYAETMALAGVETFARAGTLAYTDQAGNSQTAAINAPAFDRQAKTAVNNALVKMGLKVGSGGQLQITNIANLLPAGGFTIIVDCDTPQANAGGPILTLSNGGNVANRVQIDRHSSVYNPYFIVQSAGAVVVNEYPYHALWYGGPRRLVISCAPNAFSFCGDGDAYNSVSSGALPTGLNRLDIGWSSIGATYFDGWIKRVRIIPIPQTTAQVVNLSAGDNPVACWGDSLTAGTGATGPANYYPELLRLSRHPHSAVYNGGVGGETSTQIKTRMVADI